MIEIKKSIAFVLATILLLALTSCAAFGNYTPETLVPEGNGKKSTETLPPSDSITPDAAFAYLAAKDAVERADAETLADKEIRLAADFAVKLLRGADKEGENELLSPLSVMIALGMVANGAWSDTRDEIEQTLGMSVEELNKFLNSYILSLRNGADASFVSANSVWINSGADLSVREDFLENIGLYYDASIINAPFDSEETLGALNGWVSDKTDGMIDKILDELDADSVMLLVNALSFDALWANQYSEGMVRSGVFTNSDGSVSEVTMLRGNEYRYISGERCEGFIKDYAGGAYSFAAILPDEGTNISDYVASLDGDEFLSLVNNATYASVNTEIPKFKLDCSLGLKDILSALGIESAFDPAAADFSALGGVGSGDNLFISKMLQKTHIELYESGTRAAAVTLIQVSPTSSPAEVKNITLDRPFLYAIIDNSTGLPVFVGIIESLK